MAEMTRDEVKEFLDATVNTRNFLLFTKLLQLRDQDSYRAVMELLRDNIIDLQTIENLTLVDDYNVARLLEQLRLRYDPTPLFDQTATPFVGYDYLDGESVNPPADGLIKLLKEYNRISNDDFGTVRLQPEHVSIRFGAVGAPYQNLNEVIQDFRTVVLPSVMHSFGETTDISNLFPAPNNALFTDAVWGAYIKGLYDAAVCRFAASLKNDRIHELVLTPNDQMALVEAFRQAASEFLNFRTRTRIIQTLFTRSVYEVSNLGRPFTAAEADAKFQALRGYSVTPETLCDGFSKIVYEATLVSVIDKIAGRADRTGTLLTHLGTLAGYFDRLGKLILKLQTVSFDRMKKSSR